MNKYRKIASRKNMKKQNKMSKTLKKHYMSKNKPKKIKSNKKFRNRYQIGCSRKNKMKGGGISPFQGVSDMLNTITNTGGNILNLYAGTPTHDSPNPTVQPIAP